MVQHKGAIFSGVGLPATQTDAVLGRKGSWEIILSDIHHEQSNECVDVWEKGYIHNECCIKNMNHN